MRCAPAAVVECMTFCLSLKQLKDAVSKDMAGMKVSDSKPVEVPTTTPVTAAAAAGTDEVEEYKAKMAEKRRLAREKAELEAAQQEEIRRQQQSVAISSVTGY